MLYNIYDFESNGKPDTWDRFLVTLNILYNNFTHKYVKARRLNTLKIKKYYNKFEKVEL